MSRPPADLVVLIERKLAEDFAGHLDPAVIQRMASESLSRYDDAPVRTFVLILALRRAERLARQEVAESGL